jgi:hypothetical protein
MATGRHRDAFSAWELHEYYTMLVNPFANNQYAQNKGTDVLIFSMGNAEMEMGLSFPVTKAEALDRTRYRQPLQLRIPLIPGTLLVYSPPWMIYSFATKLHSLKLGPPQLPLTEWRSFSAG